MRRGDHLHGGCAAGPEAPPHLENVNGVTVRVTREAKCLWLFCRVGGGVAGWHGGWMRQQWFPLVMWAVVLGGAGAGLLAAEEARELVPALALPEPGADGRAPGAEEEQTPDVLFVPTPQAAVDRMVELAEIKPGELVYDLGCGDGRIVVTAAKKHGVRAVGVDINPERVVESVANARENGVEDLVTIRQADIFTLDLSDADVVFLYLQPHLNVRLMPQLRQMKPGSRIISFDFGMDGAKPVKVERGKFDEFGERTIYKWVVPWEDDEAPTWDIFTQSP
jgi:hypothetical protein